ncbi:MAG: hypothetical protein KKF62_11160 [Bacteroidetes bacterium]|nr:hypothetical protein [Bacteroidota bacterium]MBU1113833.1 hypothetical protein [Bacteroidota bacterium]MBU1798209.1 hypothetical protein [Bacteroidota bacterium]
MKILILLSMFFLSIFAQSQEITINNSDKQITTTDSIDTTKIESETTRSLEDYLSIITEIITICGLVLGIFWGFPILKKKLQENHIIKLLEETQELNKEIMSLCHKLLEKHSTKIYKNRPVNNKELQNAYLEIREIDDKAHNSTNEIATIVHLLKITFQGVLRYYDDDKKSFILTSSDIYKLYLTILSDIIFYASKVVKIPQKTSTKNVRIIKKELEPFLTNNFYKKYKYFEIGLNVNSTSPIVFQFYSHINSSSLLFQRAAYQILGNSTPIARLLYFHKIYLPIELSSNKEDDFFGGKNKIHLIGFKFMRSFSQNGIKNTVDVFYSNLGDTYRFVEGAISKKTLINDYYDSYLESSQIKESEIIYFGKYRPEIIKLTFEQVYLEKLFGKNKGVLQKKMKSEIKRT